jgi:hypothetical protein
MKRHIARIGESANSAILALILLVPVAVLAGGAIELLGGLEGGGKLLFLVVMAPMLFVEPLTADSGEWASWCIVALAEYAYLLLIIVVGRVAWRMAMRSHSST